MTLTLSPAEILAVIGLGATLGSGLFHIALYIGKLTNSIARHEDRLNNHEEEIRVLKGLGV